MDGREKALDEVGEHEGRGGLAMNPCQELGADCSTFPKEQETGERSVSVCQPCQEGTLPGHEVTVSAADVPVAHSGHQGNVPQASRQKQADTLWSHVETQQETIAALQSQLQELKQAFASQQSGMEVAEQERRREREEARRLAQEVSQLSAELTAVRARLADRFLWVKLLGQMFAPFAPEGVAVNEAGEGCAAMSERQMEQLVEHFVSGILDSHLERFRSHVDEQLFQVRDSLDELHRCQDDQLESLKKQAQAQVALDSGLEQVRKEAEGTAFRVDMLANGVTSVQDGLADVDRCVKKADVTLKAGLASMNERLDTVRHDILQKSSEDMRTFVTQSIEQVHGELEAGLISTNERLVAMRQEVRQQSADGMRALQGVVDRHIQEMAEEQSLLRQDVQHVAAQVDAMVMKVSHEATDAENTTAAMIEDFKKMQYALGQAVRDDTLPEAFADWAVDYVCRRLRGEPELPKWQGEPLKQVEEVKALVNRFQATYNQETFRKTQGRSFVESLIIPQQGDGYCAERHKVEGSCLPDKRRNETEQDYVVDYLNAPGLFLPRDPHRPVKAWVTLRRRER